jgi:cytochrome c-type biogenesis protein CcmH/NrfG
MQQSSDSPAMASKRRRPVPKWSNQMRKTMTFTFGVLVGTIVATAYASYSKYPTVDSPNAPAVAAMTPFEMMWNARGLPVERHDAF